MIVRAGVRAAWPEGMGNFAGLKIFLSPLAKRERQIYVRLKRKGVVLVRAEADSGMNMET